MRYRSNLPTQARLEVRAFALPPAELDALAATLGEDWKVTIDPGEEFDSPGPLNHPLLKPLDDEAKAHAAAVAAEDARLLAENRLQYGVSPGEVPEPVVAHLATVSAAAAEAAAAVEGKPAPAVKKGN